MQRIAPFILFVAAGLLSGCARGNVELLETRLRTREEQLTLLDAELQQTQWELARAQRESQLLRNQLAENDRELMHAEVSRSLARIEDLAIDPRLTGVLAQDPSTDALSLNLLFAPVDARGEPVKLEGRTVIELHDFSAPAPRRTLQEWEWTADETARHWHSGLIGEGFQFTLPLTERIGGRSLLVSVSFETPDGRRFHTTHDVPVDDSGDPFERAAASLPAPSLHHPEPAAAPMFLPDGDHPDLDALPPPSKTIPLERLLPLE
jgi:hypothetical protein